MFQPWPLALIGFPTGAASGIDVLDIDPDGLGWLEQHRPSLPLGCAWRTRRGGLHVAFRHADGVRNKAGKRHDASPGVAPGVDVRGDGGYGIAWFLHGCALVAKAVRRTGPPGCCASC